MRTLHPALRPLPRTAGPLMWHAMLAILVASAVHQQMSEAIPWIRTTVALVSGLLMLVALTVLSHGDHRLPLQRGLAWLCVAAGLIYGLASQPAPIYVQSAAIQTSGAETSTVQSAIAVSNGSASVQAFVLHPVFEGGNAPYLLTAELPDIPGSARLLVSRPANVLRQPDGSLSDSDGISLDITASDLTGHVHSSQTLHIGQPQFLAQEWSEYPIPQAGRPSKLRVEILSGPPGSTSLSDTTLVAIQITPQQTILQVMAAPVLLGFTLFFTLLSASAAAPRLLRPSGSAPISLTPFLIWALLLGVLLFAVHLYHTETLNIFVWDNQNYWVKTERLFFLMKTGQWSAVNAIIASSITSNYTEIPAVPLALMSLLRDSVSRVDYDQHIALIYVFPAYLATAHLAGSIAIEKFSPAGNKTIPTPLIGLAILLAFPLFLGTALLLIPDIGGVTLVVISIFAASGMLNAIGTTPADTTGQKGRSSDLVAYALILGTSVALMFVFRRWYAFSAAGVAFALGIRIVALAIQRPQSWRRIASQAAIGACVAAAAAFSILIWPLASWASDPGSHNYATLYSSYDFPLSHTGAKFLNYFGLLGILASLFGVLLLLRKKPRSETLNVVLLSSLCAVVMFLLIQTPGKHHFYLTMPLMAVGLTGILWAWRANGNRLLSAALFAALIGIGIWLPRPADIPLFASYADWKPIRTPNASVLTEIGNWLSTPDNANKRYCVIASSTLFNQEIIRNLWQIEPSFDRNTLGSQLISLGQVDSAHGAPSRALLNCDIALTATPFQFHLTEQEQYSLKSIQEDLLGRRGIGLSFETVPGKTWQLADGTQVTAHRRTREISEAEYLELLERYEAGKRQLASQQRGAPKTVDGY